MVTERHYKLAYCICICHAIIVSTIYKNFLKNSIKYFAGILTRILGYAFFDNNVASASACRWQAHCVNNSDKSKQWARQRRPVGKARCYKEVDKLQRLFNELFSVVYKKNSYKGV